MSQAILRFPSLSKVTPGRIGLRNETVPGVLDEDSSQRVRSLKRRLFMQSVSVIIPTARRPLLLERALRSVRMQSLAPLEVIVVDDGGAPPVERTSPGAVRVV